MIFRQDKKDGSCFMEFSDKEIEIINTDPLKDKVEGK